MAVPSETRIGRVALSVADLERLTGFYREVVGLEVIGREDGRAVLGAGGDPLLVLDRSDAGERPGDAAGLYHTAFRVPDRGALSAALARVEDAGVLHGASDHGVSEALYLSDPEGNGIEIYRDRPREDWPGAEQVEMVTERLDLDGLRGLSDADAVPPGTRIGHVHLEVSDLAAARRFYVETLGLRVRQELPTALFLAADDYHHHVGLNTWTGRSGPAAGRGLAWFELVVPGAVAAVRERCVEAGLAPEDRGEGFAVDDPDGITVRVRGGP